VPLAINPALDNEIIATIIPRINVHFFSLFFISHDWFLKQFTPIAMPEISTYCFTAT